MLDHLLVDLITIIRRSFERALLQRQAVEERFQVDVFLGDVSWETSYSLPGEGQPPRVRADLSIDWPTWSQTSYRSWSIGESPDELPEVIVEVALRIQRLARTPTYAHLLDVLSSQSPPIATSSLVRSSITIEEVFSSAGAGHTPGAASGGGAERGPDDPPGGALAPRWAVEATYEGSLRFDEENLEDSATVQPAVDALTRWIASTLIGLADLPLAFLPPDPDTTAG
ncbi:MAG: hypothetical protein ACYDHU_07175 [Acidimicrobiales bacterium]